MSNVAEKIKKRIIFYFYGFEGYRDNRAIRIHLNCLSHYSHIFDEALFVISLDDIDNKKLICSIQKDLIKCGFKNITFKLHRNNRLCEAQVFYNEIVLKMKDLDGLTFFGHTKGVTNYNNYHWSNIDDWIVGMYFLNLEYLFEVEMNLCFYMRRFYGAFLNNFNRGFENSNFSYSGTFYWINTQLLSHNIETGEIKQYEGCYNRAYAETFPGYFFNDETHLACHDFKIIDNEDLYYNANKLMKDYLVNYEDYDRFCELRNYMIGSRKDE